MKNKVTQSLDEEILTTNPIIKSPFVVDINLYGHYLLFSTRQIDHLLVLIIPFQLRPEAEPVCSPIGCVHKRFNHVLSKMTSFLLNHIAQENVDAPASNCCFSLPPT
jgi:hypothetical protein